MAQPLVQPPSGTIGCLHSPSVLHSAHVHPCRSHDSLPRPIPPCCCALRSASLPPPLLSPPAAWCAPPWRHSWRACAAARRSERLESWGRASLGRPSKEPCPRRLAGLPSQPERARMSVQGGGTAKHCSISQPPQPHRRSVLGSVTPPSAQGWAWCARWPRPCAVHAARCPAGCLDQRDQVCEVSLQFCFVRFEGSVAWESAEQRSAERLRSTAVCCFG